MKNELLPKVLSRLKMFRREIVAKDMIVPMWVNDSIEEIEAAQQSAQRTCDHGRTLRMPSGKLFCVVCQEYIA
jgi:hypothetical protein